MFSVIFHKRNYAGAVTHMERFKLLTPTLHKYIGPKPMSSPSSKI